MRILIAGCGDVGTALGLGLAAEGHDVFGVRRRSDALPVPIRPVRADLTAPASLGALPRGIQAVIYAVAAGASSDAAYEAAYVRGVHSLLSVLERRGEAIERFLFVSSTGVYAQADGAWVDETSPTEPTHFSGRRLLEGERLALGSAYPACVVRFGGIYGPGRTRLSERVRVGAPCVQDPPVWTNRIHRDDCAGVLRHLLLLPTPEPLYLGVDCKPATECEVMDWIAARLGLPPPQRVGADVLGRSNKRCCNARLLASGYRFAYPTFREGYAQVLAGAGRSNGRAASAAPGAAHVQKGEAG